MLRIFISSKGGDPTCIFKAFYLGTFQWGVQLDMGSFAEGPMGFMNGLSPIWRSAINSIGKSIKGDGWSGAFAQPYKPYIKGTEPLKFEIKCFLPLIQKGDGTDTFAENIETPVANLIGITSPWKSSDSTDWGTAIEQKLDAAESWLFNDTGSTFWKAVQGVVDGMKNDFFKGIYMLNNPPQFDSGTTLTLRIGPWRVSDILISSVSVEYSPLIYNDGKEVYPSFANVSISCLTQESFTPDLMNIYDKMSPEAQSFISKGSSK